MNAMMTDPEYCEIDVTARATLEKRTVVIGTGMHPCVEGETEPDGTRSYVTISEPNDDVRDLYRNQEMSPAEIFHNCEKGLYSRGRLKAAQALLLPALT